MVRSKRHTFPASLLYCTNKYYLDGFLFRLPTPALHFPFHPNTRKYPAVFDMVHCRWRIILGTIGQIGFDKHFIVLTTYVSIFL